MNKWDRDLKKRLEMAITDSCGTKEAVKTCLLYIKNEREELLKRLPSVEDVEGAVGSGIALKQRVVNVLNLVKEKLEVR